jgi:hypothetical protein
MKNLRTCIAVFLFLSYIMAKAQSLDVNNGIDTSQNKTVTLAGYSVQ